MNKIIFRIPYTLALGTVTLVSMIGISYHILILAGIVPIHMVWGGRFTSWEELWVFEVISGTVNLLLLLTLAICWGWAPIYMSKKWINILFKSLAILFIFNTIGNILAVHWIERYVFSLLTFLVSIQCYRIALGPHTSPYLR